MKQREMDIAKVIASLVSALGYPLGLPDTRALAVNQYATQMPWRDGEAEAHGKVWPGSHKGREMSHLQGLNMIQGLRQAPSQRSLCLVPLIKLVTRLRI